MPITLTTGEGGIPETSVVSDVLISSMLGKTALVVSDEFDRETLGSDWLVRDGSISLSGGKLLGDNADDHNVAVWAADTFDAAQFVVGTIADVVSGRHMLVCRATLTGKVNYVGFLFEIDNTVTVVQSGDYSTSELATDVLDEGPASGDVMRLEASGENIRAYVNGQLVLECTTTLASGQAGIGIDSEALGVPESTFESFHAGNMDSSALEVDSIETTAEVPEPLIQYDLNRSGFVSYFDTFDGEELGPNWLTRLGYPIVREGDFGARISWPLAYENAALCVAYSWASAVYVCAVVRLTNFAGYWGVILHGSEDGSFTCVVFEMASAWPGSWRLVEYSDGDVTVLASGELLRTPAPGDSIAIRYDERTAHCYYNGRLLCDLAVSFTSGSPGLWLRSAAPWSPAQTFSQFYAAEIQEWLRLYVSSIQPTSGVGDVSVTFTGQQTLVVESIDPISSVGDVLILTPQAQTISAGSVAPTATVPAPEIHAGIPVTSIAPTSRVGDVLILMPGSLSLSADSVEPSSVVGIPVVHAFVFHDDFERLEFGSEWVERGGYPYLLDGGFHGAGIHGVPSTIVYDGHELSDQQEVVGVIGVLDPLGIYGVLLHADTSGPLDCVVFECRASGWWWIGEFHYGGYMDYLAQGYLPGVLNAGDRISARYGDGVIECFVNDDSIYVGTLSILTGQPGLWLRRPSAEMLGTYSDFFCASAFDHQVLTPSSVSPKSRVGSADLLSTLDMHLHVGSVPGVSVVGDSTIHPRWRRDILASGVISASVSRSSAIAKSLTSSSRLRKSKAESGVVTVREDGSSTVQRSHTGRGNL